MPKIYSTFADHPAAQRAVDQMIHGGFATADVYIDPNWQRDLFASGQRHADGGGPPGDERKGVLQSIGHAVASVVGMDTPDADAQPSMQGRRRGGTLVVVDAVGEANARRAMQLLRGCGGMDVHEAGRRVATPGRAGSAQDEDEDGVRSAEAERSRTVERAMAADHANSGRAWDAEAPRAGAADRLPR